MLTSALGGQPITRYGMVRPNIGWGSFFAPRMPMEPPTAPPHMTGVPSRVKWSQSASDHVAATSLPLLVLNSRHGT